MSALAPEDFSYLSGLIKDKSGIVINEDKIYLLESRLLPLLRKYNLSNLSELAKYTKEKNDERITKGIIDLMTTNETYFFRDGKPFEQFRNVIIPYLINKFPDKKKLRILSLACSSGQEPYSLAMCLLEEKAKTAGKQFEIAGLDLSDIILDKAKSGTYSQFEVQRGLPITLLVKYFTQDGEKWKVKDDVKSMVKFHQHNAMEDMTKFGEFDFVLCRNVLIYFDQDTKAKILDNIAKILAKNSIVMVGSTESIYGVSEKFIPFQINGETQRAIYSLKSI